MIVAELNDREQTLAEWLESHEASMRGAVWLLDDVHEPGCDPFDPFKVCKVCLAGRGLLDELAVTQR